MRFENVKQIFFFLSLSLVFVSVQLDFSVSNIGEQSNQYAAVSLEP